VHGKPTEKGIKGELEAHLLSPSFISNNPAHSTIHQRLYMFQQFPPFRAEKDEFRVWLIGLEQGGDQRESSTCV